MTEVFNQKLFGVRAIIHAADESPDDPRRVWVHHSFNEDGTRGDYEMTRWFSIETVRGLTYPTIRIIFFRWSFMLYRVTGGEARDIQGKKGGGE